MIIGTLILLTFGGYLWLSLLGSWQGAPGFTVVALILSSLLLSQAWLFFFFFRSGADEELRFEKPLRRFAFHSMGALSFLFTFSALRDLMALPLRTVAREGPLYGPDASLAILVLSCIGLLLGFRNARNRLATPEVRVAVKNAGKTEIRITLISDLHLGNGPDPGQVRRILSKVRETSPHLLVLTGDIIDGAVHEIREELQELARCTAPLGVYFVLGNHECYWNAGRCLEAIRGCGIEPLLNEGRILEFERKTVFLAGVTDPAYRHFGGPGPVIPLPPPGSDLRILLAHQPQIAEKASILGYDLQLSGHTHGGQFFPWNLVVKRMYRHPEGLHRLRDLWIYVSRGTGFWGPPVRLGTEAEVATLLVSGIET